VKANYSKNESVCPRCTRPASTTQAIVHMATNQQSSPGAISGAYPGTASPRSPGVANIRHKQEIPRREWREGQVLTQRFQVRAGAPTRAVNHRSPPPSGQPPRFDKVQFSASSNCTPFHVAKPWYESKHKSMEQKKAMRIKGQESFSDRRLYCDQKVCTKLQAQKDFMRPGW